MAKKLTLLAMSNTNNRLLWALPLGIILCTGFGGIGGALALYHLDRPAKTQEDPSHPEQASSEKRTVYIEESSLIDAVKAVQPAVVSVVVSKDLPLYREQRLQMNPFFGDPFGFGQFPFSQRVPQLDEDGNVLRERRQIGGGSGFIVSGEGLVATNRHVVEDEEAQYTVILNDGREFDAQVIARDSANDLALVQMKEKEEKLQNLPVAQLGDSQSLQVGQRVVAIGNALAEYQNTVTTGIISATGRSILAGSMGPAESLLNLIQTDASINPGNSGGPLANLAGEIVGINTAIAANAQGIGFAIPINDVKSAIESVKKNGKIVRPYLGVRFMMLDESTAKELEIGVDHGALLVGNEEEGRFAVIPASPAEKAGLKIKDVILEVDGEEVTLEKPLNRLIQQKGPQSEVALLVWRSGQTLELQVKLEEEPRE